MGICLEKCGQGILEPIQRKHKDSEFREKVIHVKGIPI
jgi:hypothetical protein